MSWENALVIGARAPSGTGVALGLPVLRIGNNAFVARDVATDPPVLSEPIDEEALTAGDLGSFVRVPAVSAKRGFITVVSSQQFDRVCKTASYRDALSWVGIADGDGRFAYLEYNKAQTWKDSTATELLAWSSQRLAELIKAEGRDVVPERSAAVETCLRQVRYLCEIGSHLRHRMAVTLGALLYKRDADRLASIAPTLAKESGVDVDALYASVRSLRMQCGATPPRRRRPLFKLSDVEASRRPMHVLSGV